MEGSLVSVVIPVYNVELYVERAIRSIINQTYVNLEIIVIDDFSNDNTYSILRDLSKNDPRIRLIRNTENLKIAKTLNRGLEIANGEFIARMDGDDISELDRISKKVHFLQNNTGYDLVGCSIKAIDKNDDVIGSQLYPSDEGVLYRDLRYKSPVSHIWVARKRLYDQLKGYRDIPGVEDYDFLLRMTSEGYRYTNLEEYYGYCVRLGREGNTISTLGIVQIRMHKYVMKLHEQRMRDGVDNFNIEEISKLSSTSNFGEKIHSFSSNFLFKAIVYKNRRKYFVSLIFILLALVSPYQVIYLFGRFKYKLYSFKLL